MTGHGNMARELWTRGRRLWPLLAEAAFHVNLPPYIRRIPSAPMANPADSHWTLYTACIKVGNVDISPVHSQKIWSHRSPKLPYRQRSFVSSPQ